MKHVGFTELPCGCRVASYLKGELAITLLDRKSATCVDATHIVGVPPSPKKEKQLEGPGAVQRLSVVQRSDTVILGPDSNVHKPRRAGRFTGEGDDLVLFFDDSISESDVRFCLDCFADLFRALGGAGLVVEAVEPSRLLPPERTKTVSDLRRRADEARGGTA